MKKARRVGTPAGLETGNSERHSAEQPGLRTAQTGRRSDHHARYSILARGGSAAKNPARGPPSPRRAGIGTIDRPCNDSLSRNPEPPKADYVEIGPEWGRLNARQRYNVLALDIHRAIAFAGLGPVEGILFERAQEEGWHGAVKLKRGRDDEWPEPRPARLNLYALAKETGIPRERLREARKNLLASRMFLPASNRSVWINKQAHEWIHPTTGKPRLGPLSLDYCSQARPKKQEALAFEENESTGTPYRPQIGTVDRPQIGTVDRPQQGRHTVPTHREERGRGDLKKTQESFFSEGDKKNGTLFEPDEEEVDYMAEALNSQKRGLAG